MLDNLKKLKRRIDYRWKMMNAYYSDYKEYSRWQYNNPHVKTKNAMEARILRQTHVLEKGMSVSKPKEKFGVQKALDLLQMMKEYQNQGYSISSSTVVKNSLGVVGAYIRFHEERGYVPEKVIESLEELKKFIPENVEDYGICSTNTTDISGAIHGEFPAFISSRHSVRQYSDRNVDIKDIKNAIALAMHAPSACNRQSVKAYFYTDESVNSALGELIAGNTGFDQDVKNYIVITSDMSAFYDPFERNQVYVDGGIFTMALIEALHYYGIASCVLQNGEYKERNLKFKEICGNIPENEKIILFVAIGYYKKEFEYATSHRKKLNEVLKIQ